MTTPDFLAKLTELTKFLLFAVFSITTSNFSESIETIKNFRYMVLGPYILFIAYLIFNLLAEASYWGEIIHA